MGKGEMGEGGPPSLPPNRMFPGALYILQEEKGKPTYHTHVWPCGNRINVKQTPSTFIFYPRSSTMTAEKE